MWLKCAVWGTLLVCIPFNVYAFVDHFQHHEHRGPNYPHMRKRDKRFPWSEKDCDLFDVDCKREARASAE